MGDNRAKWGSISLIGSVALAAGVFALDLAVPLGVANGVLYAGPVLLALSAPWPWLPIIAATVCSLLTIIGAFLSPTLAEVPLWLAGANRLLTVAIIWAPTLYFLHRQRIQETLERAYQELERRVQERTQALSRANRAMEAEMLERQKAEAVVRESQARLAGILDLAEDAVISADDRRRIVLFNQGGANVFGYTPDEALGRPLEMLFPADEADRLAADLREFAGSPNPFRRMGERGEVFGRRKNGSLFPAEASLSKLMVGGRTTFTLMLRDVTDRKQAEEQLRSLAAQLLTAQDQERRRMARDLHDDINQRLAVLAVDAVTLEHHLEQSPQRVRQELRNFQQRLAELSDDVRRLAYQFHPSILDDLGLATALQRYVEDFSSRTGIRVRVLDRGTPNPLPRDVASCLYRVAQESLGNVVKHAGKTDVVVELGVDGDHVGLIVRDFGSGMPESAGPRPARGLGLVSMKERVRMVKGSLTIESRPGLGTQVRVLVPLAVRDPDDEAAHSARR